ncbi:MAG: glycosyltransferase [Gammaproteobacteria bacterium]|nr:glycosyltransferase [Gammaproteobacteria bacterium]
MRIVHLPFDYRNPYQKLLARHLEHQGVEVVPRRHPTWRVIDRMFREWRADGLHFHWLDRFVSEPRSWLRAVLEIVVMALQLGTMRLLGKRMAWTVHNLEGHEGKSPWRERALALLVGRACHVVFVHSHYGREQVMARFRVSEAKIVVIAHGHYLDWYPNTVEPEAARAALGLDCDQIVFLFLGNIRPYKGVTELLAAYATVATPETMLLIAGRPLDETTQALIIDAAVDRDDVQLHLEFVPDAEVQTFMKAADVVVFPYRNTLSSGALVLAMGFGKACIAPNLGGIPELLDAGGGAVFDADDENGLTMALQKMLESRKHLAAMGRRNRERAESWSWDDVARATCLGYLGQTSAANREGGGVAPDSSRSFAETARRME